MTDEEKKVSIDAFIKEYGELTRKHQVDFASYPFWQPDGNGGWLMTIQTQPVSTKDQPVKSPFVPQV